MSEDIGQRKPFTPGEALSDDETLKKVREIRMGILTEHLANGIPTDSDGFEQLHKNLVELDKGAFKSKQIKQDEQSSAKMAALAQEIANTLARNMGSQNIFEQKNQPIDVNVPTREPTHLLGISEPVPGELSIGDDTRTYDEFSNTVGKELDEKRRAKNNPEQ